MVLINIETLTDSELKSIACQEDIEDWESLSREELIDELESIYEDNDDSDFSGTLRQKYVSSLIPGKSDYSQALQQNLHPSDTERCRMGIRFLEPVREPLQRG